MARLLKSNEASPPGYAPDELVGRAFSAITHPDNLATDVARGHELLARRHRGYRIPKRYVHRDGHEVSVDLWCTLVCDDAGEPVHFVT